MQVPAVDATELKKAWLVNAEATWGKPPGTVQTGRDLLIALCGPDTNVDAVAARVWYLDKLVQEAVVKAATEPLDAPFYPLPISRFANR